MTPTHRGSIRLFRLLGINVYLHWSWFVVALFLIKARESYYTSWVWNALEYIGLFFIVLLHELGHCLACRQVGGQANQIVLWPLGGVAYVAPPARPGATLWSIAAGPLVNVALIPILTCLVVFAEPFGWDEGSNGYHLVRGIWFINALLLFFNLLPIYPLDGGQILRSILWFFVGRARSLFVAAMVGFAGVALMLVLAVLGRSPWFVVMALFILLNCTAGLFQARLLAKADQQPRRQGFACPTCKEPPVTGSFWGCHHCRRPFDPFATDGVCPNCGGQSAAIPCLECGQASSLGEWRF